MRVVVIAGPNGSGKSTLIERLKNSPAANFPDNYINADDIARSVADRIPDLEERNRYGFHQAEELRQEAFRKRESFAFETVMSHPSKIVLLKQLREAGYHVVFEFVCTSRPEINVDRVRSRVLRGGHSVPEDRIVARWSRTVQLLPCAVEVAHEADIYDSDVLPTRLKVALLDGVPFDIADDTPPWLHERLLTPLRERAQAREEIAQWALTRVVETPDEQKSEWEGLIVKALPGYCVQESDGRLVRHDCRLLKSAPGEGEHVRVSYIDGWADVVDL